MVRFKQLANECIVKSERIMNKPDRMAGVQCEKSTEVIQSVPL